MPVNAADSQLYLTSHITLWLQAGETSATALRHGISRGAGRLRRDRLVTSAWASKDMAYGENIQYEKHGVKISIMSRQQGSLEDERKEGGLAGSSGKSQRSKAMAALSVFNISMIGERWERSERGWKCRAHSRLRAVCSVPLHVHSGGVVECILCVLCLLYILRQRGIY